VVTRVPEESALAADETVGPVVRIEPVPDIETAIERANDTECGGLRCPKRSTRDPAPDGAPLLRTLLEHARDHPDHDASAMV
jgi:hypothetical protein